MVFTNKFKFKFSSAPCGSGKTYEIIRMINEAIAIPDSTERYILVHGEIQMIKQSASQLNDVTAIYSDTTTNVEQSIVSFLKNPTSRVLVISDKGFFSVADQSLFEGWEIYLDDVVNMHAFDMFNTVKKHEAEHELFTGFTDLDQPYRKAIPVTKFDDDFVGSIECVKFARPYDKVAVNSDFFDKTDDENGRTVYADKCNQLSVLAYRDISKYLGLNITFVSDKFETTMMYLSNPALFEETQLPVRQRVKPLESRLFVRYFLDKHTWSSTFSDANPSVLQAVGEYIEQHESKYYWTCNSTSLEEMAPIMSSGEYITPMCRGINQYMDHHVAVWLCSLKPSPQENSAVRSVFGITKREMIAAREYSSLHQFACRSNLRDYNSETDVVIYVMDREQAESLCADRNRIRYIDLDIEQDKTPGKPGRPVLYSDADKRIRKLFSNMMGKRAMTAADVTEWCNEHNLSTKQKHMINQMYDEILKKRAKKSTK